MNVWVPISPILFPFSLYRSPLYSLSTYIIVLSRYSGPIFVRRIYM